MKGPWTPFDGFTDPPLAILGLPALLYAMAAALLLGLLVPFLSGIAASPWLLWRVELCLL